MHFFAAKPLRGAIRPYVPGGVAMESPVGTIAFPRAGTITSSQLHKSNPAASGDPLYGSIAFSESRFTLSGGSSQDFNAIVNSEELEKEEVPKIDRIENILCRLNVCDTSERHSGEGLRKPTINKVLETLNIRG
mmetsp:Transcript_18474/g.42285  ORF Transcript_18474/g.42285 Transcript_18474/m.42285 type:complete len:134 (+) Transcript_18474:377-778(+)